MLYTLPAEQQSRGHSSSGDISRKRIKTVSQYAHCHWKHIFILYRGHSTPPGVDPGAGPELGPKREVCETTKRFKELHLSIQ